MKRAVKAITLVDSWPMLERCLKAQEENTKFYFPGLVAPSEDMEWYAQTLHEILDTTDKGIEGFIPIPPDEVQLATGYETVNYSDF